jgi:outer membrane receptor protein involved in Fe transport
MKKLYVLLLLASQLALGQKISISGRVADTTGIALPGATVMLLNTADSSLVNFGLTNPQGVFEIRNVNNSPYFLKVTFVGYKTYSQTLQPSPDGSPIQLGILKLRPAMTRLDEVVVEEKIPVVVKKDTIEFNAEAFKTKPNANVEELLKKLPGVEVDNDGNITAQGESVSRIMVDGKDFFGGKDPKLATRNLPADAIKKVQVLDKKSDQTVFSGVDDGQREKAINLELKEEKRHAAFGNFAGGYGTDDRFQLKGNLNRFDKGKQMSVLGMANNINEQGFSMDDYANFTGAAQTGRINVSSNNASGVPVNFGNRANGVMKTYAGGLNFNNELSKKTEVNGSYFYNYLDHDKSQNTFRENFLQNGSYTYTEDSRQNNTNNNHRLNVMVDHKLDSMNSLRLTTNASYNETKSDTRTTGQNVSSEGQLLNTNESTSYAEGVTESVNSNLLFRHRFAKKGRNFSTNLVFNQSETTRDGLQNSMYKYADEAQNREVHQRNAQDNGSQTYGTTLTYTEPLGNRMYIEGNYSFNLNKNQVNRPVYDLLDNEEVFNDSLSNRYQNDYIYHKAGMNFKVNREQYSLTVGGGMQDTRLKGDLETLGAKIDRSFSNFVPAVRFNYDFSTTRHLRFDYETAVQEPSIQQLQPVVDNRDQLNPYKGNPALRPSYQQSWRANYISFDPGSMFSLFAFVDVSYTTNAIVNSVTTENFIRTTTPVNVKDKLSTNANTTLSFPITKLKSRLNVTANWRNQRSINLIDDSPYYITQNTTGGNVRYNFRLDEIFDFTAGAMLSYQRTSYQFDQPDQTYFNQTYLSEANLTIAKNYQLSADLNYLVYHSASTNFSQSLPMLNLSVSRFVLKNKSGEIKLTANNVLDKALGVNQTTSINYIERTTSNAIGRYFMVSFVYSLNKQLNPMNGRRRGGPGPVRIMREG